MKNFIFCVIFLFGFWVGFFAGNHNKTATSPRPSDSLAPARSARSGPSPSANSFPVFPRPESPPGVEREKAKWGESWSRWSLPYNTRADGWAHEHGIVQYRTNLDTGLVEERNVR